MATVDLSRDATDFRKRYAGARMQQGRVLSDDDFNNWARIDEEEMRRTRVDVIGPVGTPDLGFLPVAPAAPLPPGGKATFDLAAGSLYLGGLRLEQPVLEPFHLQKDWLNFDPTLHQPDLPTAGSRIDLVWIEAWQQPVAAEEDSEKFEAALGSADTAMNVRTMRRVRMLPDVQTEECSVAWAQAMASWAATDGMMAPDNEVATQATLRVTYSAPATAGDLCSPPTAGGYLGAENQAIRVQMVDSTHYTWGFDNAAPIYRVQSSEIIRDGVPVTQVKLQGRPKDAVHWPLKGQVVEILPWSAALPNRETLAENAGHLARVTASYNPDTQTLEIDTPLPAGFGAQWKTRADVADFFDSADPNDDYFFLRVWNRGDDLTSPLAIPIANGSLGATGLSVAFLNGPLRAPDYWIIGARPATPDQVVPWRLEDVSGAPPHGVRRYRAPLGLIRWTVSGGGVVGQLVHDCRPPFFPLTRKTGCCTATVGNGTTSFGMFTSIQAAVDSLPPTGGVVCVQPGTYNETVVIAKRQNVVIHGCDARSHVRAVSRRDQTQAAFLIVDSQDIGIEHVSIEAGPGPAIEILRTKRAAVRECIIQMRDVPTTFQSIWARGEDLVIDRNLVDILGPRDGLAGIGRVLNRAFDSSEPPPPPVLAQAARGGIQLGGGCRRVRVLENVIRGGIWNGITLGSLLMRGVPGDDVPDKPSTFDPCDPCKPLDTTDDEPDSIRIVSAGDLEDIEITGNTITEMGANGISVVRFFNLAKVPVLINVKGLHIAENEIRRCVRRRVNPPTPAMLPWVGYGGITLAAAQDLRISRNQIAQNGVSQMEPISGIFAIVVENAHIDGNRITENGPYTTEEPVASAIDGTRGGIWIWLAIAKLGPVRKGRPGRDDSGVAAASICDNIIVAPVSRAITMFALGASTIARNRLVSQGTTGRSLDRIATTVLAVNLGISNEWTVGLLAVVNLMLFGSPGPFVNICLLAKQFGLLDPKTGLPRPPLTLRWPTGKTLVTENQINSDVVDSHGGVALSSAFVASLDDVAVTDNQCEIDTVRQRFLLDLLAMAGSVRIADNRMSETWRRAIDSGWGMGLMSTVTDNQSTHCMRSTALLPGMRLLRDNLPLVNAFCPNECGI